MPSPRLVFVVSSPRSGSTMLERMLEAHSQIAGGPEPHLMTPMAHLGLWDRVTRAPYDAEHTAHAIRTFADSLPEGETDYYRACRAYADTLYGKFLEATGKPVCLDKTPAYALVAPFLAKVYPDARFVVLTRHPFATFSSFANSFFDGDYEVAQRYNPLLNRYVPALAGFLRDHAAPIFHVRYEDLVLDPGSWMARIHAHIGVPHEAETVNYGQKKRPATAKKGLGDPIGVKKHVRPTDASIEKWAGELLHDERKRAFMKQIVEELDASDLVTLGYPKETLWEPLERAKEAGTPPPEKDKLTRYRLQRKVIVRLRGLAQRSGPVRACIGTARAACEALLEGH